MSPLTMNYDFMQNWSWHSFGPDYSYNPADPKLHKALVQLVQSTLPASVITIDRKPFYVLGVGVASDFDYAFMIQDEKSQSLMFVNALYTSIDTWSGTFASLGMYPPLKCFTESGLVNAVCWHNLHQQYSAFSPVAAKNNYIAVMLLNKQLMTSGVARMLTTEEEANLYRRIDDLLGFKLGFKKHLIGYKFARVGIALLYQNPDKMSDITNKLYPTIAQSFGSTPSRVERAIRHGIDVLVADPNWGQTDTDHRVFGASIDSTTAKPSNSQFLMTLADKLRLEDKLI